MVSDYYFDADSYSPVLWYSRTQTLTSGFGIRTWTQDLRLGPPLDNLNTSLEKNRRL